ncbi:MAG: hypothetical protein AABY15_04225 [Nanoarchaeota archaeon]
MIQRHKILLNTSFSATTGQTAVVNSATLISTGDYQVNNIQGLGGGIVNFSNVRAFLNDDVNDIIINDFFSYLTGTTTTIEFAEIYNSDQKLADVFNEYYVSSVLNNQVPSTSVINNSLTGTTEITIIENNIYNYDGFAPLKGLNYIPLSINESTRKLNIYSALTTFTNEESYYVPVFILKNYRQMARLQFDVCDEIISLILNPTGNTVIFNGTGQGFGGNISLPEERVPSGGDDNITGSLPVGGGSESSPFGETFSAPFSPPTSDGESSSVGETFSAPAPSLPGGSESSSGTTASPSGGGSVAVGGFSISFR